MIIVYDIINTDYGLLVCGVA